MGLSIVSIDGRTVARLVEIAHRLMHESEQEDCDPHPLLLTAVAFNALRPVFGYVEENKRPELLAKVATMIGFAIETEIEQIVIEMGEDAPEELKERQKETLH